MSNLFVKKLTVIDFSYLCSKRGLVGESWQVDIELAGSLDHQGMVLDFSEVKKTVKRLIDDEFDHKLVIPTENTGCSNEVNGKRIKNRFQLESGAIIEHIAPDSAYCMLPCQQVSTECMAKSIKRRLKEQLPDNVEDVGLTLYPEAIEVPYYHYSHGLKHHGGNCQRIAHGHRSRIEIFEKGQHCLDLEQQWAEKWRDIYIGTRSDIYREYTEADIRYIQFRYTACQGQFELSLPADKCYLVDIDTTVENLAAHISSELEKSHPDRNLSVYAYEGIDKGAVSHLSKC